jgi:hypothetical protein
MFFFIGLTMATIQGAYARRISPGQEVAAVKQVGGSLHVRGGRGTGSALDSLRVAWLALRLLYLLQAMLLLVPAFLLIGWGHSLPVLGLGLLLYSFGEWALLGLERTHVPPLWADWCLPTNVSPAAAVVVPCLSSVVASYGESL